MAPGAATFTYTILSGAPELRHDEQKKEVPKDFLLLIVNRPTMQSVHGVEV